MMQPPAPPTKEEVEAEVVRYGIRMAAITIMVVVGFFSSCSMMPDWVDEDEAKVKEAEFKGNVAMAEQKHKQEMAKIAAVERLIKEQHVDPVAARCAVNGWDRNDSVCEKLVKQAEQSNLNVNITTKQEEQK